MSENERKLCTVNGMKTSCFMDQPDHQLREKGPKRFVYMAQRRIKAFERTLAWTQTTPIPRVEDFKARLRSGPGNDPGREEGKYHPWCVFHNCVDRCCIGIH